MFRINSRSGTLLLAIGALALNTLAFTACIRVTEYIHQESPPDQYLSGLPLGNAGPYLETMARSVKRISSTTYYTTYYFELSDTLSVDNPQFRTDPADLASQIAHTENTTAGSAVVVFSRGERVGLLSTWHIFAAPDTLYEFHDSQQRFVSSMSVKNGQVNWLQEQDYLGTFQIVAKDEPADLAFLGIESAEAARAGILRNLFPVFPHALGHSEDLMSGVVTYSIGYPRGYHVVSKGIVSNARRGTGTFTLDTVFNPGFSGGAVVAIRGGIPRFEWIGLAASTSVSREWILTPDRRHLPNYVPETPWEHEAFAERKVRIDYGITHAVQADRIRAFFRNNQAQLRDAGFSVGF